MLNHFGFSCWISSDEKQLATYSEESIGSVKSAWIASEAGKPFSVHWQDKSGKCIATCGHVFVDGKEVATAIIRPGRPTTVKRVGVKVGGNKIKPFVFSELSLTDDDTLANQFDASLRDVGVIKIGIRRVRCGERVPFAGYEANNHGLVHERAKKAGAHCTKFEKERRVEKSRTVSITTAPYDPNEQGPYVTFEFRYRSIDTLKAIGIVQNDRKRSNESGDDDVIEISSDDDEDSSSSRHSAYRQTGDTEPPSKKRVKREPQTDEFLALPQSSPSGNAVIGCDRRDDTDNVFPSTRSQQDDERGSERPTSPTISKPSDAVKEENEEEEELDMLNGDDEGTASTDPSQDVDSLAVNVPPPSSSLGPEDLIVKEDDE